jgi:hypothetical protein
MWSRLPRSSEATGFLMPYAVERDFGGLHLGLDDVDVRVHRLELTQSLHHAWANRVARGVEVATHLAERLLAWRIKEYSAPP